MPQDNRRWSEISDEEFIERAKDYSNKTAYAGSYGLSRPSPNFNRRIDLLEISFRGKSRITREAFEKAVENAVSITQVVDNLGKSNHRRGYFPIVKHLSREYGIPLPKFDYSKATTNAQKAWNIPDDEYFKKNTSRTGPTTRKRLIKKGWAYKCSIPECPLYENPEVIGEQVVWAGRLMTLQVDHIDGDHHNNELNNLRFLCPNCHAASDTYAGKNKKSIKSGESLTINAARKRKDKPVKIAKPKNFCKCGKEIFRTSTSCQECESKNRVGILNHDYPPLEVMISQVEDKGYYAYGKELGTSDNAIRKHLRRNGVNPLPKKLPKSNFCVDCPKSVHRTSIRCPDCARKHRYRDNQ